MIKYIKNKQIIFWTLIGIIVLSAVFYVALVTKTVNNVVERRAMESKVATMSVNLSELEFEYISLKNNINLELAQEKGFVEVKTPYFASKKSSKSLSVNLGR